MSSPLDSQSPAERLYFDFAAKRERGEASDADFEQLCMAHPELTHELRQLARKEQGFRSLFAAGEAAQNADSDSAAPLPRVFTAGEELGDFRLERSIGAGGMGQVWEATQISLQRRVALKFVRSDRVSEPYLARFEVEARAGGRADHPNLVRTLGRGQADGIDWIAQELVVGAQSLRAKLDEFRREPIRQPDFYEQAALMIRDAALGMQAAHDAGVIHRDLKPENILLDRHGSPRIVDFGLARMVDEPGKTATGHVAGTLMYMSPEQTEGKSAALDHRTDIFSLGVVLYELLTLQRPFEGESSQEILEKVRTLDPIDPRKLRANCPQDLSTICLKALEKRPGARYATMRALAEDLDRFRKHEPILARPSTRLELARKWVRRNPAASVGIGVGAVALVVISGVAIYAIGQADRAERGEAAAQRNAEEAKTNMELAERNAETAQHSEQMARQRANDILSLSAQKDLDDLIAAADSLWPVSADMVKDYEIWIARAQELLRGSDGSDSEGARRRLSLKEHEAKLAEVRSQARIRTPVEREADRRSATEYSEWTRLREQEARGADEDREGATSSASSRRSRIQTLGAAVDAYEVHRYDDVQNEWWDQQLSRLIASLRQLEDEASGGLLTRSAHPDRGWGMLRRREEAIRQREQTLTNPEAKQRWEEAIHAISVSERYRGTVFPTGRLLTPQEGLLPLGADPQSGLWEFGHVLSGDLPQSDSKGVLRRSASGAHRMSESRNGGMCIVLVLIPGGVFAMGAQRSDADLPNYDEQARAEESPVRHVTMSPYFISKYEMTQGQWRRLAGNNPSYYQRFSREQRIRAANPVEQVDWLSCAKTLRRFGLCLPSEAQWERACRAGTTSAWWTGAVPESLKGTANLADQSYVDAGGPRAKAAWWPEYDDGFGRHAPVGSFLPNAFGLHDMHGNVWEWCEDVFADYNPHDLRDPLVRGAPSDYRVKRGGAFSDPASLSSSALRESLAPTSIQYDLGVRPARSVHP